jgi:hypothetical protein
MPSIALQMGHHWTYWSEDPEKWTPYGLYFLSKDLHSWLSQRAVRHTMILDDHGRLSISILDTKVALLFKLTWGGS